MEREVVITRIFDAPRDLVFQAWTEEKHMRNWYGPKHFTNPVCEMDVRVGGKWRIVMRGPDGDLHPAKGVYREIVEPERLVMTIDHSELPYEWHDMVNPGRNKEAGKPALQALVTVFFEDQGGKTKLTIQIRFDSAAVRDSGCVTRMMGRSAVRGSRRKRGNKSSTGGPLSETATKPNS